MREHNAIFVKADSATDVYKLRNQIVLNAEEFKSVSKYLARVGLFTTGDIPKGDIPPKYVGWIDDVKVINNCKADFPDFHSKIETFNNILAFYFKLTKMQTYFEKASN